jgi:hypothetical protein
MADNKKAGGIRFTSMEIPSALPTTDISIAKLFIICNSKVSLFQKIVFFTNFDEKIVKFGDPHPQKAEFYPNHIGVSMFQVSGSKFQVRRGENSPIAKIFTFCIKSINSTSYSKFSHFDIFPA